MNRRTRSRAGFTLIEILVVILVLGVLAALVAPNVFQHVGSSKTTAVKSQLELIGAALDTYRLDNDDYPSSEQGLAALFRAPIAAPQPRNWRGPYLKKSVPPDPWGNPYVYRSPGVDPEHAYELLSYGRDGKEGGTGDDADIRSWD
ncbi:MAG TPA: type II secretion system major pseudopilin GspG [Longimicrobiaceae bacterium]|nr:type II secretion system major pseudopilin GspG [Longimicrobiaceae bacterium]